MPKLPLIVILGPTAVGKTTIGIKLAKEIDGEIISADSMQIYKQLNIGTAKISAAEMQGIAHHLLNIKDINEKFSVAEYQKLAEEKIKEITARGKLPLLVGGTGLYLNSVINSQEYNFLPTGEIKELRQKYQKLAETKGADYIYQELSQVDPISAQRIHPHDLKRIIRALEVYFLTGKPISSLPKKDQQSKYDLTMIGLDLEREILYERINQRVELMLEKGWLDEIRQLLNQGASVDSIALQGLGYKELIKYLQQEISYEKAIELIKRNTRRYAKRQMTWFRRDKRIRWIDTHGENENEIVLVILSILGRKT